MPNVITHLNLDVKIIYLLCLIEAAARRPAPDASDERRNYYRITDMGLRVARAEARRLEGLTRAARIGGLLAKGAK
jgi:hypothetical protein